MSLRDLKLDLVKNWGKRLKAQFVFNILLNN